MKKISVFEDWRREMLIWIWVGGGMLGIIIVSMNKDLFVNGTDFLGTNLLYEMKHMSVDYGALLFDVIKKRMAPVICIMILATTYLGVYISYGYAAWIGMSMGMFVAVSVIRYGVKGILLFMVITFPHYLIYLPAWLMLLKGTKELCFCIYSPGRCKQTYISGRRDEIKFGLRLVFKVLGVVIIGIILESYVNPKLLMGFLKIF